MRKGELEQKLLQEMKAFFPWRWEVAEIRSRMHGSEAAGTIKIYCSSDNKTFLTDFEAKLDARGGLEEFSLDGVVVKKKLGCEDAE